MIRLFILCLLACAGRAQSFDDVRAHLVEMEGISSTAYRDSLGHLTIGVGHLLPEDSALDDLTDEEIETLLRYDVAIATEAAHALVPTFDQHPDRVKIVIVGLCFNLGRSGFERFVMTRRALDRFDYEGAADRLSKSRWARQLPSRARAYCVILTERAD